MSLARNAGRMSIAVFLSRILGLVREQVFAALFGAGLASDAYLVAFRIPNLLRDLFAEGALSQAFVTVFSRAGSDDDQKRIARDVMTAMSALVLVTCLLIAVLAPWVVDAMAGEFAAVPGKIELTTGLTRLFSPFLFFASSAALAMGVLNTLGSFFLPAMGSAAFNLGNILVGGGLAMWLAPQGSTVSMWGFGVGTLVGGFWQWSLQWPALRKRGYPPTAGLSAIFHPSRLRASFRDPDFHAVLKLMAPSILSIASVQINVFIGTWFVSSLGQGAVSWNNYAYRLMHFPMGVFGVALSTAALPRLASLLKQGKREEFEDTLSRAVGLGWMLAFGSTVGLVVLREPLLGLLYEHGRFHRSDTTMTGQALMAYAVGLVPFIVNKILVQAFYALDRVWVSSALSLGSIVLSVGLNFALVKHFGHAGVPLSSSLTALINMCALAILLRGQGVKLFSASLARSVFLSLLGGICLASLAMAQAPAILLTLRDERGFMFFAISVLATVVAGGALYIAPLAAFSREGRELLAKLFRRR